MAFDGITIAGIVKELNDTILNGRIYKIAQPETDELLITIKTPEGQKRLSISASASLPLIFLTDENKPSPMTAPNFCMLLRKHIGNGRITGITQPSLERIIQFDIEHLDELGDICRKALIVEIMGKHSNIIFCNDKGMILDSIKHVSAQMSSVREVLPGRDYFIPETSKKRNPLTVNETDFIEELKSRPMAIGKALYNSFTGISPSASEEICHLAAINSDIPAKEYSEDVLSHVFRQFTYFFEQIKKADFTPSIYNYEGTPKDFSVVPLTHLSGCEAVTYTSVSDMIRAYYATKNVQTRIRQKSVDLRKVVQTALDRNRKKFDLQQKQLRDTENREKYKIYGELLHVYGYNVPEKAKSLDALNYYTNETITIPLDPQKTAAENAQKYFEKYNKQKRTFEALTELIKETKDEIIYLESISNALDIARSEEDLLQLKEELMETGYIRRKFSKKKVKITSKPLHYLSSDGYHIYVGKNNLQNEELTFHFANGNDWWFHAKGTPGSHVIVRTNGDTLPDRTFEEAGRLAAYYSKNAKDEKVEIDYAEKKYIKKPSGAKPGFVVYYTNYSLMIDSDISGIQEIPE